MDRDTYSGFGYPPRALAYYFVRNAAGLRSLFGVEPYDCAGRTTLDGTIRVVIHLVIYDRQVVNHCDHFVWRVDGAFSTGVTGHFTILESRVSLLQVLAGHPESVTNRVQREQILRTSIDTVSTRGTGILDDDRQIVLSHKDRIEVTYGLAVA